jgi:heat shock protein beta
MARLMAAQGDEQNPMFDMLKKMPRVLEINPKSPLITGLLSRVLDLGERDGEDMSADEAELAETARILFDTTLVRSGFEVEDPSAFFERVEALLRASVGVRLDARADARVLPAPPTASEMPAEAEAEEAKQRERDEREERGEEPEQDDNDKDDFARQFEKMGFNVEAQHEIDDDSFVDWEGFKKEMEHDEL